MRGKRMMKMMVRKYVPLWPEADHFSGVPKKVFLSDNGLEFSFQNVSEKTVGEFLTARGLALREKEFVFPSEETAVTTGMKIFVARTHDIVVQADGAKKTY